MTKAPTPTEMSKGQSENTNNSTKKFDYTAVADRLWTVSWSNNGHPTGVVNLVYGPNLPTLRNSRVIERTHVYKCVKPQSDIHCNRSATSPRPKFKTVAEESQLGFAVGRRLIGDWSATSWGPLCDLMQLVADQVNLKLI